MLLQRVHRSHRLMVINRTYAGSRRKELIKKTGPELALENFDGLYSHVYGKSWPSIRLGLLSQKKQCAVINPFVESDDVEAKMFELGALYMPNYYKKHLRAYTLHKVREQILDNKKARKRELLARESNVDVESIDPSNIEVSDISDSELLVAQTTDASDEGFSSAEDLQAMFSDRRLDDDEKYFVNQASTQLSLEDFMPATELYSKEEQYSDLRYYEGFKDELDKHIEIMEESTLEFGNELRVYSFPRNSWLRFDPPAPVPPVGLYTHYMIDGASLLAVYALNLQPSEICADYCAAPGGKSLAMLMTLRPSQLTCNEKSTSRHSRMARVHKQYLPDIHYVRSALQTTRYDARKMVQPDTYDKILVDVPCSNDRESLEMLDNNLFSRVRTAERLELPSIQTDILKAALKSLKLNGCAVYSTCTLSPVENDGVVQKAIIQLLEENWHAGFAVMNLKEAFRPFRGLYRFRTNFLYGQQVLPNITSNYGPMYIAKIKRIR